MDAGSTAGFCALVGVIAYPCWLALALKIQARKDKERADLIRKAQALQRSK